MLRFGLMEPSGKTRIVSHRDLLVWQRGIRLVDLTYEITEGFPKSEQYGLRAQMRESAVSVPANIAEGHGRHSTREYLRFLGIANASLRELDTYLEVCELRKYLKPEELRESRGLSDEVGRMLSGLTTALRRRIP